MSQNGARFVLLLSAALLGCALFATAAKSSVIVGSAGAVTVHGEQTSTHKFTVTENGSGALTCTTVTFSGSLPAGGSSTPVVHPTYDGCTFAGLSATVKTDGCDFEFHVGTLSGGVAPHTLDIECGEGAIVITTLTCEVRIPTQQGLTEGAAGNKATDIALDSNLKGIKYQVTKDGIGCPMTKVASYTEGDYVGSTTFTASSGTLQIQ